MGASSKLPGEESSFCPGVDRDRRERCPQCRSREYAVHWCPTCTDSGGHFSNHPLKNTVKDFRDSAERESAKCRRCIMILACLEQCNTRGLDDSSGVWMLQRHYPQSLGEDESTRRSYNKSLLLKLFGQIGSVCRENMEIFILPNTTSPLPSIGAAQEVPPKSSSKKSLEHAQKWLADCRKNHKQCTRPTDRQHLLPKRLVDVLSNQERGPVRLIETSSGQNGRYLCLSHCWGDPKRHPQPLETTRESLGRHKQGIPWKNLPKTFQDAVSFVRWLGESYIWIDSLCIVQDCPDDWNEEASKMADVYTNSDLTLAATKSTNSTEGLFSTPDDAYKSYPYTFEENGSTHTFYFRKSHSHFYSKEDADLDLAPLLKRAWVYQERLLSPRTLHFGNSELLWECKTTSACQCGAMRQGYSSNLRVDIPLDKTTKPSHKTRLWQKTVENYSSLELTKESDRLPAIAGIAKRMQYIQGLGDYLAGLWKESLLEDLVWGRSPLEDDISFSRQDTSVAPTWSWVCLKATRIKFWHGLGIKCRVACLVDAKVQSDQQDAFTKASSGYVIIKSYLFTVRRPKKSLRPIFLVLESSSPGNRASFDNSADSSSINFWENDSQSPRRGSSADVCLELGDHCHYYPDQGIRLEDTVPHEPWIRYLLMHTNGRSVGYLLVLRAREDGCAFERIGFLHTGNLDWDFFRRSSQPDQMQTITIV